MTSSQQFTIFEEDLRNHSICFDWVCFFQHLLYNMNEGYDWKTIALEKDSDHGHSYLN